MNKSLNITATKAIASAIFHDIYPDIFSAFDKYDIPIETERNLIPDAYYMIYFRIFLEPTTPQISIKVTRDGKIEIGSCWDQTNFIDMVEKEVKIQDPDFIEKSREVVYELLLKILNKRNKRMAKLIENALGQ